MNSALWAAQILLALFMGLASAAPKLLLPPEMLPMPIPIPRPLLVLIGVAELAGALGLVLPGFFKIRPGLTPLAAAGLALVATGGVVYQIAAREPGNAIFAAVFVLLFGLVGIGRWLLVPHRSRIVRRPILQPAR